MRVSNALMADQIKSYLSKQTQSLLKTQEQLSSGKRINRLSDDPIGIGQALGYRKTIAKIDQYGENIDYAQLHIQTVDDILATVSDLLKDAKDIAADLDPDMRDMLADQVVNIRDQVFQLANYQSNGNYIFAGDLTDTQPFELDTATGTYSYAGDNGTKDQFIGDGLQMSIEADGSAIFQGSADVFDTLNNLESALRTDDTSGINDQLSQLEDAIQGLNDIRAVNAGKSNRMEATKNYNESFKVTVQGLLSGVEDADKVAAAVEWQAQQTAYETTLATAAQLIQPTLMDFLK